MFKLSIFIIYTIKAYTCIVLKFDVFHFNVIFVRYILVGRPSGELDLVWFDFILWVDILILTCVTLHSNLFLEPNRAMRVQFLVQVNNRPTTLIQITFSSVSRARYVNHSRASSYGLINYVQNNPEFTKYFKWSENYLFFAYCKTTNILTGTSSFISVVAFKDWHRHLLHGLSQSLIQVG